MPSSKPVMAAHVRLSISGEFPEIAFKAGHSKFANHMHLFF